MMTDLSSCNEIPGVEQLFDEADSTSAETVQEGSREVGMVMDYSMKLPEGIPSNELPPFR